MVRRTEFALILSDYIAYVISNLIRHKISGLSLL